MKRFLQRLKRLIDGSTDEEMKQAQDKVWDERMGIKP